MPYVPSKKTDGQSTDREVIDIAVEYSARQVVKEITNNNSLCRIYKRHFVKISNRLWAMLESKNSLWATIWESFYKFIGGNKWEFAKAIFDTCEKYDYEGAHLGEFNYAITRFVQRVPQIKVGRDDWKDELRYWLYAQTVSALVSASRHTEGLNIGVDGVFVDVKDEYKWRVNRPYETAQIIKNGDCYDTPYYNKPVEVVNDSGEHIGHIYVDVKRSKETGNVDLLNDQIVLRKRFN